MFSLLGARDRRAASDEIPHPRRHTDTSYGSRQAAVTAAGHFTMMRETPCTYRGGFFTPKGAVDGAESGVTLVEMMAVLLLLGIMSVVVLTRTANVQTIDNRVKTNRLHNHLRYAQSMAMKRNTVWGIKSDGTGYWLFSGSDPDLAGNKKTFPGEDDTTVSLADLSGFTVFYDGYGRPFSAYTSADTNTPLSTDLTIQTGDLFSTLSPETGFVQ
jgi:prepilin-type N-terminal cleavage/methylation domain-containing protein